MIHLSGMHENSPPESVFALDLSGLQQPEITVWSVWEDEKIASIGALKFLGNHEAEIKSMRTHPSFLRQGAANILLDYIINFARKNDIVRLSLETGCGPAFEPALALYRKRGFTNGPAFGGYKPSAFNQFLHLDFVKSSS